MSTHDVGFFREIRKNVIFLASNFVKWILTINLPMDKWYSHDTAYL